MWELKLKSNNESKKSDVSKNTAAKIEYCLRNIKGIGPKKAIQLLNESGISRKSMLQPGERGSMRDWEVNLNTAKISPLANPIPVNKRNIEKLYNKLTELRRDGLIDDSYIEIWLKNIARELKINSYRGTRHRKKFPLKGRTRSNANTRKRWKI